MNSVDEAVKNNGLKVEVDFQGKGDDLKSTPFLGDSGLAPDLSTAKAPIVFDHDDVSDLPYLNGVPGMVSTAGIAIPLRGAIIIDSPAMYAADIAKESDRGIHIVTAEEGLGRLGHIIDRFPPTEEELDASALEHNIQRRMQSGSNIDVTKFDGASQVDYLTIDSIGSAFDEEEVTITPEDALKLQDELNVFEFMAKATPGFKRDIDFEKRMALNQLDLTDPEEIVKLQAYMQLIQKPMDIENMINKAAHNKMKKKSRGNKTRWREVRKGR